MWHWEMYSYEACGGGWLQMTKKWKSSRVWREIQITNGQMSFSFFWLLFLINNKVIFKSQCPIGFFPSYCFIIVMAECGAGRRWPNVVIVCQVKWWSYNYTWTTQSGGGMSRWATINSGLMVDVGLRQTFVRQIARYEAWTQKALKWWTSWMYWKTGSKAETETCCGCGRLSSGNSASPCSQVWGCGSSSAGTPSSVFMPRLVHSQMHRVLPVKPQLSRLNVLPDQSWTQLNTLFHTHTHFNQTCWQQSMEWKDEQQTVDSSVTEAHSEPSQQTAHQLYMQQVQYDEPTWVFMWY